MKNKKVTLTVLFLAFTCWASCGKNRPTYIYVNQTQSLQGHDLALKMSLKIAERRSGVENALVLLRNLPPNELIQETATRLFSEYQIGKDRGGKGLMYLYAEKENLFKIEVSYALEGIFPDAYCRQLEEAARTYMLSDIPQDFLSELLITMNLRARDPNQPIDTSGFSTPEWLPENYYSGGGGVKSKGYRRTYAEIKKAVQSFKKEEWAAFSPDGNPSITTERYLKSLEIGIGDPNLPLLTPGSRIFRMNVPRNRAQQKEVFNRYNKGLPYRVFSEKGDGLVIFNPGPPNLPIVLRKDKRGLWYIDEPKAWTYFHRWEDNSLFFPKYADVPHIKFMQMFNHPHTRQAIYGRRLKTPTPVPLDVSLDDHIENLEAAAAVFSSTAAYQAALGEAYLFELNWIGPAIEAFERARNLEPDTVEYHWRLFDLHMNHSEMEKALNDLAQVVRLSPNDNYAKQWYKGYKRVYAIKSDEF